MCLCVHVYVWLVAISENSVRGKSTHWRANHFSYIQHLFLFRQVGMGQNCPQRYWKFWTDCPSRDYVPNCHLIMFDPYRHVSAKSLYNPACVGGTETLLVQIVLPISMKDRETANQPTQSSSGYVCEASHTSEYQKMQKQPSAWASLMACSGPRMRLICCWNHLDCPRSDLPVKTYQRQNKLFLQKITETVTRPKHWMFLLVLCFFWTCSCSIHNNCKWKVLICTLSSALCWSRDWSPKPQQPQSF